MRCTNTVSPLMGLTRKDPNVENVTNPCFCGLWQQPVLCHLWRVVALNLEQQKCGALKKLNTSRTELH